MLKQRILTISILLPLFIWLLWFSSNTVFLWVTVGVISLAVFEWFRLLRLNNLVFAALFLGFLGAFWLVINYLKANNKYLLVFACLIIIAADIGAYIFGKLFGKHKLTIISPGKTWEGVLGGYLGSLLVSAIYLMILNNNFDNLSVLNISNLNYISIFKIVLLISVTFIFSIIGDLFESWLKRSAGVKDSGNILPGHGGILDRIDSFCSGIPMFLLSFLLLNKYLE